MKFIAMVEDAHQKFEVHLELPDDETGRARVGDALAEIQQRFIRRTEPKKPALRPTPTARPSQQTVGGEGTRGEK
jgi:hypothetical protein